MAVNKNTIKETFITRSWVVWIGLAILGILILSKIFIFQHQKRESLLSLVKETQRKERTIDARRGNIYASDGISLLATSTEEYKAVLDPSVAKNLDFNSEIDALSKKLATFYKDKSAQAYKEEIVKARKSKLSYLVLNNKKLNLAEKAIMEEFPLFNLGRWKGGGYFEESGKRFHPYHTLAERTIGDLDKSNLKDGATGIETEFNNYLRGIDGKGLYERLPGGAMKPINVESDIDATPGYDVITTLDVNFQDIAESSLRKRLEEVQGKYGSVVVMEVATGEVKAIANLTRLETGNNIYFSDDINYAVVQGTDPGSTFKLASMLAILEKSNLKPTDFAVNCSGSIIHGNHRFTCAHAHGNLTVEEVFEKSCNIGVYRLMQKTFGFSKNDQYYNYLADFRLTKPTGFQLKGEPFPLLKNSASKSFSNTTIPWMSIGYESRITPLQMLTFYNMVANGGYWVQPLLVKEIRAGNVTLEKFSANTSSFRLASETSIKTVQKMMEKVVLSGTAKNINYGECTVAGKTGTAQKRGADGKYKVGSYYTSFIGYFPTHQPKYSCVVVIDEPVGQNVYGGDVCAPVFKNIADKIYAYDLKMHKNQLVVSNSSRVLNQLALSKASDQANITRGLLLNNRPSTESWSKPRAIKKDSVVWAEYKMDGKLEGFIGMTLKDALPLLEREKYKVQYSGIGKIADINLLDQKVIRLTLK